MIEVKVEGLKALQDELLQLPEKVGGKVLQGALSAAALPIVNDAKARVPQAHKAYKLYGRGVANPGWLRERVIRKKVKNSSNSAEVIVTVKDKWQSYFWRFIEFGTSKMPAHPFLRPAFEAKSREALDRFSEKLAAGIEKSIRKLKFRK